MPAPRDPMRSGRRIPEPTVRRLSGYCRSLEELERDGRRTVSSARLAELSGVTGAQVRKDLACLGRFGRRGLGYHVPRLLEEIRGTLGLDRRWKCALVGAGHLGSALFSYQEFRKRGFDIVALFDRGEERLGQHWGGVEIQHVRRLVPEARRLGVRIGIVATPARAAQEVAELLVEAGVSGILNFAACRLSVPREVAVRDVSVTTELERLTFALRSAEARRRRRRPVTEAETP